MRRTALTTTVLMVATLAAAPQPALGQGLGTAPEWGTVLIGERGTWEGVEPSAIDRRVATEVLTGRTVGVLLPETAAARPPWEAHDPASVIEAALVPYG